MAQYKVNSKCHLPAGWIGCVCGGGGDGGGGEGGLGRKASRQLISAPLSSLKGSGLLCRGALDSLRAALGCPRDTVSPGHPAKWHWCLDWCLLLCAESQLGHWASSQWEPGRVGGARKAKKCLSQARHAWWGGKAAWRASLHPWRVSLREVFFK